MKRVDLKKLGNFPDTVLTALEVEEKDYRLKDCDGLYFYVRKTGNKSWQFRYKNEIGGWTWKGLGQYPKVKSSQARKIVRTFLNEIADGVFFKNREEEAQTYSLRNLMESWLNTKRINWENKTFQKAQASIQKHIYCNFAERDFRYITAKEWFDFFQNLQRYNGITSQVEKLFYYVKDAYDWASISHGFKENPIENLKKRLDKFECNHFKFIEIRELPNLIQSIRSYSKETVSIALELMLILFPRPSELRLAKWEHFDLDHRVWMKPAELTKNRKTHKVPLSEQAVHLIKRLKQIQRESDYLFPGRGTRIQPLSDGAFNHALRSLGYGGKQDPHGFRHLASTALNEALSSKSQIIEAALAHIKKGTKGIYDKAEHFEERAELMQWWADYVYSLS